MKKSILILLIFLLIFNLCSCGSSENSVEANPEVTEAESSVEEVTASEETPAVETDAAEPADASATESVPAESVATEETTVAASEDTAAASAEEAPVEEIDPSKPIEVGDYVISLDNINVRDGAGKSHEKIDKIYANSIVKVLEIKENVDGYTWYRIGENWNGDMWIANDGTWLAQLDAAQQAARDKFIDDGYYCYAWGGENEWEYIALIAEDDKYSYWYYPFGDIIAQDKKAPLSFGDTGDSIDGYLLRALYEENGFKKVAFKSMKYYTSIFEERMGYEEPYTQELYIWSVTNNNTETYYMIDGWFDGPGATVSRVTLNSDGSIRDQEEIAGVSDQ